MAKNKNDQKWRTCGRIGSAIGLLIGAAFILYQGVLRLFQGTQATVDNVQELANNMYGQENQEAIGEGIEAFSAAAAVAQVEVGYFVIVAGGLVAMARAVAATLCSPGCERALYITVLYILVAIGLAYLYPVSTGTSVPVMLWFGLGFIALAGYFEDYAAYRADKIGDTARTSA